MGDVWPEVQPGSIGANYGTSKFSPTGSFPVRSFQTFTIEYTVGEFGLDDTGAIKIVGRWTDDGGQVQFNDPQAANYVTATASNNVQLELYCEPYPHQRPWYNGLRITVKQGYMCPGDTITIVLGDRRGGSPGFRLQTFCETAYEFRILADVCATGVFLPVASHCIEIKAGAPEKFLVTAPSLRRTGEYFAIGVRCEDAWGNATEQTPAGLRLCADAEISGLPNNVEFKPGARGARVAGICATQQGVFRFRLIDEAGEILAISNPIVVQDSGPAAYWGDLHGQSGETVGINPMRGYLEFARDVAFLDVTSHQANDFQITNAFWQQINELTAEFNIDGQFTVFPGYEWSGNTPVGGDHNVFFAREGNQIHRSSHALLKDRSDIVTDANNLADLFQALQQTDCVIFGHIGGRPADISYAEDPRLRTAVEVHSDWGTFEWIMTDAFQLGYRVGLVCNSDGHKGAPGACYPGASEFGAYSGLTCFLAEDLSRAEIFKSMRRRRHYGTTGCRMHLQVTAHLGVGGAIFSIDPRITTCDPVPCDTAQMGDIVQVVDNSLGLTVYVEAHAPIERVDILNGAETIQTIRPYKTDETGRLRVIWQGAEYRGRGRTTSWRGTIKFDQANINRIEKINYWNQERTLGIEDNQTIAFDVVTTGNFGGCDVWLDCNDGTVAIDTDLVSGRFPLSDIAGEDSVLDAGGLDRKIRLYRLPQQMAQTSLQKQISISLIDGQDNPLWVRVVTEDGHVAWSSPIYVLK